MVRHAIALPFVLALALFCTPRRLGGPLLFDDKAAVVRNPVVNGAAPLARVWEVDFWGLDELHSAASHKSFRPLVTLTYRANYVLHGIEPFGYHVVNVALHAINSALAAAVTTAAFGWCAGSRRAGFAAALLFAAHPVHAEAVQNTVGRAELLMALFYQVGFLCYAHLGVVGRAAAAAAAPPAALSAQTLCGVGLALACALAAMLCKETGVTLPLLCVVWDALVPMGLQPHRLARALGTGVRHLDRAQLEAILDHVRASPAVGTLELIVRRPAVEEREVLSEARRIASHGIAPHRVA
jgi:hypothetical protein